MESLVQFVVAGTQKGGTSALAELLQKNHHVFMASPKELHYFDKDENCLDDPGYSRYHTFFGGCSEFCVAGEATPMYMYSYDAPRRIWEYNKDMKFILLLRNPIERAYSAWNMERDRNIEECSFKQALIAEGVRRKRALPNQERNFSYVDRGYYSEQIRRIWNYFPKKQTLIVKTDDLKINQQFVLNKIWDFLGVPRLNVESRIQVFSIPYQSYMSKDEFDYLYNVFYLEICVLEHMLGWDCSEWKHPRGIVSV